MLKNYVVVAVRNLGREKSFAIINIGGLAIGLTICLLVMAYIIDEYSFDRFHTDSDRIYRVIQFPEAGETQYYAGTPFPVRPMILENVPSIESVVQFTSTEEVIVSADGKNFRELVNFADPEFFEMFSFKLLQGNSQTALAEPNNIVLNASGAERIFGSLDIIGRELVLTVSGSKYSYVVSAVAEDTPSTSSLRYNFLLQAKEIAKFLPFKLGWNLTCAETFVRIRPDADLNNVCADLQAAAEIVPRKAGSDATWKFTLQALSDVHLNTSVNGDTSTSSPVYSYLLGGIGLMVLLLACINFTTLAIGRSQRRIREIGVRKVMGASESQLYGQLLSEALIVSLVALVTAFALAEVALPTFNSLSGKSISSVIAVNGIWSLGVVALVVLTALLAGAYPSRILTRAKAVEAVRGKIHMLSGGSITRVLVALQFTLSAALIAISLSMSSQIAYMRTAPLGFNKEELLMLQLRGASGNEKVAIIERLRNSLNEDDGVISICASGTSFNGGGMRNGTPVGADSVPFSLFLNAVDEDYLKTMGLELIDGTHFHLGHVDASEQMIINETCAKFLCQVLDWESPLGKSVPGIESSEIIGVIKDYHIRSLAENIEPMALLQVGRGSEWSSAIRFAFVRIRADNIPATMKQIQKVWGEIAPNLPYSYEFMDEHIDNQYRAHERWEAIVNRAALLSVVIACFGVFGLTALAVARRRKELGIRKVLGARSRQLVAMFCREFSLLVFVGNVIAVPIAYWSISRWISGFVYRTAFSAWPYAASLIFLLAIVILTVSLQAVRASAANPSEVMRYE